MFEELASIYLIPVLRRFECSYVTDVIFSMACVRLVAWVCQSFRKGRKLEDRYQALVWSVLFLWGWYRFFDSDVYVLYKLYSFNGHLPFCYVDGIAVGCFAILFVTYFHREKMVQYRIKGFLLDKPIDYLEDDVLNRGENANDAVRKLLGTNTEECAFTFGIVGQWGDGKTSFMNMMKRSVENEDDVIVMDYSPWLYNEAGNITREFFKVLRSQLSEYGPAISSEIAAYSDALAAIDTPWSKYLNTLVSLMAKPQTAEEQYTKLEGALKGIGKKIVVFVDDIDRLGAREMSEVFRLVRNTSNLPHMYFVLAYDKEYVVNTLQQEFGRKSISFTDKIMQEEYPLPKIQAGMLMRSLILTLQNFASAEEIKEMEEILNSDSFFRNEFFELANTLRDIKRLGNRLGDHYERMHDDVMMRDYLLVSLMQQKFPKVYTFVSAKRDEIFLNGCDNKIYLYSKEEKKSEEDKPEYIFSKKRLVVPVDLLKYIDEDRSDNTLEIQEHQRELLKRLLEALWAKWRNVSSKGVNNRLYCSRYFYHNVLEQEMTEQEFEDFWKLEFDEMKERLPSLIQNKLVFLIRKLETIPPSSRDELRKLLRIMFFVNNASAEYSFGHNTITTCIGYLRAFHSGYRNYIKSDKDFVRDLLLENKDCRGSVEYLRDLQYYNPNLEDFPMSVEEMRKVKRKLFLSYAPLHRNDFKSLSYIFMNTARNEDKTKGQPITYDDKCLEILKYCAMDYFENFIPMSLNFYQPNTDNMYTFSIYPRLLWGSNEKYIKYVEKRKETSDAMMEYKRFCRQMRGKKKDDYIKFSFKALKVNNLYK